MRAITASIVAFCLVLFVPIEPHAEKRIALVIGNAAYTQISALANPKNDAELIAETLTDVGFEVVLATDIERRGMARAIRKFGRRLRQAGTDAVGLFYYAGHGVQASGNNYLVPRGAVVEDEADLDVEAISASYVLRQMESAGNRLNLVIFDACRNNPYKSLTRSDYRGLVRIQAASGTLIAFAAAPGTAAFDGAGTNSPYTAALAEAIKLPGLPVEQVFKRVRVRVEHETGGKQTPWEESSLRGNFYFNEKEKPPPVPVVDNSVEIEYWSAIQGNEDIRAFQAYLEQYPQGLFAALAATIIERLSAAERRARETQRTLDTAYWNSIKDSDDPAHIQVYLDRFPNGKFSALARIMIKRMGGVAKPEPQNPQIALVEPETVTTTEAETAKDPDLPRKIQSELARVGCNPDGIDGRWGRKSKAALDRFAKYAKLALPDESVSDETLRLFEDHDGRVCPLLCGPRQVERNGRCIAKSCPRGQKLTSNGVCRTAARQQATPQKPPKRKPAENCAWCEPYAGPSGPKEYVCGKKLRDRINFGATCG